MSQSAVCEYLTEYGESTVKDISRALCISPEAIRRNLATLAIHDEVVRIDRHRWGLPEDETP